MEKAVETVQRSPEVSTLSTTAEPEVAQSPSKIWWKFPLPTLPTRKCNKLRLSDVNQELLATYQGFVASCLTLPCMGYHPSFVGTQRL